MDSQIQVKDRNFEQCMKCSICTAYCPVTLVNQQFPGPKQSGPDGERYRLKDIKYFDKTLEYCLNCKRCEVACPSDVKIADIIQVVRFKHAPQPPSLRNRILAGTDFVGNLSTAFSGIINPLLHKQPVKIFLDKTLGIDNRRLLPYYAKKNFRKWYKKYAAHKQKDFKQHVAYFHGCYVNYNYPQLGKDLIKILNAVGIGVQLLDEQCCGMPMIMNGLVSKATQHANHNVKVISEVIQENLPVLTTGSTCTLTLRDEYRNVLGIENGEIRASIFLATRFLYDLIEDGKIKLKFKPDEGKKILYHTSCHMEKLGWAIYSSRLLSLIPGSKTIVLDSTCCGLAGTHGYKKENYSDSQNIGETLFKRIAKINPQIVATDCESCKWQIEMSTPYTVMNPISIIANALDVEATVKANADADKSV